MRKLLTLLLALFVVSSVGDAQLLVVRFKDEKAAKRYRKQVTVIGGETVILGEPIPGGGISIKDGVINYRGPSQDLRSDDSNHLWLLNPKDPAHVPYEVRDGKKETTDSKATVSISGGHIDRISMYMPGEDISSLAREYGFRKRHVDTRRAARDELEKGSSAWFVEHQILVTELERLVSWLEAIVFEPAAKKLRKSLDKERKVVSKAARQMRAKRAVSSVQLIKTPKELVEACKTVDAPKLEFHVQESQHVRIVYLAEIGDTRITNLLKLFEQQIDGLRAELVDPYLSEDFPDRIPDTRFQEFWLGPSDDRLHDRFLTAYYKIGWGAHKPRLLRSRASKHSLKEKGGPEFLHYSRWDEGDDVEGELTHILGHALAALHYNGGDEGMDQVWIEEGLGIYLAFEYFGRNSMSCFESRTATYVKPVGEEGAKSVLTGLRGMFNRLALDHAPRVDKLAIQYLYDFGDPEVAKSWSLFDYVAREMGRDGQRFLRSCCEFGRDRQTFLAQLRPVLEEILGVDRSKDAFRVLDDRWREFASGQQDVSEEAGR